MINWVAKKHINFDKVNKLLINNLNTNQFANYGPNVKKLELLLRDKLLIDSSKSIICVTNGSAAIHALVCGMNMFYNKELRWATQSFTFPSSAQGILKDNIIVDIDNGGGLDLNKLNEYIDKIDGIIVTNVFGNIVDIDKYEKWCKVNDKLLLFDNAATVYTFYKNKNSLNYANGASISFHHTKPIGFGEGGAIIVDNIYESEIRRCINFGISTQNNICYDIYGSNFKMSEITAAFIIQYLDNFDKIIDHHNNLYDHLKKKLIQYPNISLYPNFSDNNPFVACFCLLADKFDKSFINKILTDGIFCRKYYVPLNATTYAMNIYNKILCLPCNLDINKNIIDRYIELITDDI